MASGLKALLVVDAGQDLIEYGLLASLIAIAVVGAVLTLGGSVRALFWDDIGTAIRRASGS